MPRVGWLIYTWQVNEETNKLEIFLGTQLGVRYLTKHGCIKYLEDLFAVFIAQRPNIILRFDEKIKPELKGTHETEDSTATSFPPIASPVPKVLKDNQKSNTTDVIIYGKKIKGEIKKIVDVNEEEPNVVICGKTFGLEIKQLKTGRAILIFNITDLTDP